MALPWQAGVEPGLICSATSEHGEGGSGGGAPDIHVTVTVSPNIHPIPASETISAAKMIYWSQNNATKERDTPFRSLYELIQFSIDPNTKRRSAVATTPGFMPFELSNALYHAGMLEHVHQHVDQIVFCPWIIMTDPDQRNTIHLPNVAFYVSGASYVERRLLVNLCKQVGIDPNGDLVLKPKADFELFPDIIEGAARLHIMTNVINGEEPSEHMQLSYIRRNTLPLQISAIEIIMGIFEQDRATDEPTYVHLKRVKQEYVAELEQLNR